MLDGIKRWLAARSSAPRPSAAGRPLTPGGKWEPGGGVSSFHLWWQGVDGGPPAVEVSATFEVLQAPVADRLYFWALQAGFSDGRRSFGAAHTGLQWNQRHPGNTAVNWGGYADTGNVHTVLDGSLSPLPSRPNDPNTRDYPWRPRVPYRFRIFHVPTGWRCEITDLSSGTVSLIRDLYASGDRLAGFVVWAEIFAACDDPPASVRWSDFAVVDSSGAARRPGSVRLTFPSGGDCPNTDVMPDEAGFVLMTNVTRTHRDGDVLRVPG